MRAGASEVHSEAGTVQGGGQEVQGHCGQEQEAGGVTRGRSCQHTVIDTPLTMLQRLPFMFYW